MNRSARGIFILVLLVCLSACVKPIEPTPTPRPTDIPPLPTPTQPPILGATFPPETISAWLQATFGMPVTNLTTFMQLQVGPDDIVGYTYQDVNGQRCAGVVLTTAATGQIWNGDMRCVPAGTAVIAAPTLLALTNGEPYVATFIYIESSLLPTANAVSIVFPDGTSLPANNGSGVLQNNGYVGLRSGFDFPLNVTIIEEGGNRLQVVSLQ